MTDTASRTPMLHLPASALLALHRALARDRPPAEAATLLRQVGFETGSALYGVLQEWATEDHEATAPGTLPPDRFWQDLGDFFADLGWGTLHFERLHPGVASLSSSEWVEAETGAGSRQPTCHLSTGILSELLSRVADAEIAVMEVECRSRGDERCRFLIGSSPALQAVYESMTNGLPYAESLDRLR